MDGIKAKWVTTRDSTNESIAKSFVGRYFRLDGSGHPLERKGAIFTRELRAGLVTFSAMAYIISVNASILSATGGPCVAKVGTADADAYAACKEQVRQDYITATSAIAFISSFLMGLLANMPLGLAPGLGVNAYFAFTVVGADGQGLIPYGQALAAVFLEGWLFLALSILGMRQWLGRLMPRSLTLATGAGIGMYLAFIGLGPNGLSVVGPNASDMVGLGGCPAMFQDETTGACLSHVLQNPTVWLGVFLGGILTGLLFMYRVRGAFFWPILLVAIASWPRNSSVTEFPHDNGGTGDQGFDFFKQVATWHSFSQLGPKNIDWNYGSGHVWLALITFLYVDVLDTTGTLYSMSRAAGLLDEVITQDFEGSSVAYLTDAFCISMGSLMGLSPCTAFIESASGIAEGGRTGLTGIMVSFFFFLSLFFAPIFASIPAWATGSTLVIVGSLMMKSAAAINWEFAGDAIPAFLVIAGIPFMFSISYGLIAGIVSWMLLHNIPLILGKIHPSLLPPGWNTTKEPYNIAGTLSRGSKTASFKTLLPPWVVKLLSGNPTFWRATQEEIDVMLEGRRLTQARNKVREEQQAREREEMRQQQVRDDVVNNGFRKSIQINAGERELNEKDGSSSNGADEESGLAQELKA
jgi:AGZA family xanthine/uracil permease-like MFS transporter